MSNSPLSDKRLSEKQEKRLLEAGDKLFRTRFPNPERIGCPGTDALKTTASRKLSSVPQDFFDHLTCCSPCFVEYHQFLDQARRERRMKAVLALSALVAFVAIALFWFSDELATFIREEPISVQEPSGTVEQVAVLDLRGISVPRGPGEPAPAETGLSLSRATSELRIYLPIGSEEGNYEVQLVRSTTGPPIIHAEGTAELRNQIMILEVEVDLTEFAPGKYLLGVRLPRFSWRYYTVNLEE